MDDAAAAVSTTTPAVGTAYEVVDTAGGGVCQRCMQPILQDSLRVGKASPDANGHEQRTFFHPACWPVPRKLTSLAQVVGWAALGDEQREVLEIRAAKTIAAGGAKPKKMRKAAQAATASPRAGGAAAKHPPAVDADLTEEDEEEAAWLHNRAAAAGRSPAAAATPSGDDGMSLEAWTARAPPGLKPEDLAYVLEQTVDECAEALPGMLSALEGFKDLDDAERDLDGEANMGFIVQVGSHDR